MNVRNCRKCRRLFNYVVGPHICPECRNALEEQFQVVRKYVQDHKNCDIQEVADACDVDPQDIRQWIREERLQFSEDSMTGISCEACGVMIRSGRYCEACRTGLMSGFKAISSEIKTANQANAKQPTAGSSNGPRMRFR